MFDSLFSRSGLSIDRLRSLVEVADAGGIAGAAPGDTVRQSQISRNLSQLESFFGRELKRRRGKGIELTEEGNRLATLARTHLQTMEDFLLESHSESIEIRIGGGQSTLDWLLLPRLSELPAGSTPHRFVIESMRSHDVVRRLNDFSLDVGVVRKSAITTKRIRTVPFATVRYSLFVRRDHAKKCGDDALEVLRRIPLATSMGGDYRRKFDDFLESNSIAPDFRYTCSSFRTALEAVKRDSKVAALLPDSAGAELNEKQFTGLPVPFLHSYQRNLVLAWHERLEDLRPQVRRRILALGEVSAR